MNKLEKLKNKWQKRLNLENWDIRIRYKKFKDKRLYGRVKIHLTEDIAIISVIKEKHYKWIEPYDLEFIILHEMLHVAFTIAPPDKTIEDKIFERGLNRIAWALLKLDRK